MTDVVKGTMTWASVLPVTWAATVWVAILKSSLDQTSKSVAILPGNGPKSTSTLPTVELVPRSA